MDLSVVIPAYNECNTIKDNVLRIKEQLKAMEIRNEIIVVNDGSTDGTFHKARKVADMVLTHYPNRGKGSAILKGIRKTIYEYVAIMDADLQVALHELQVFLRIMELYNADGVVGSKRHPYSNLTYPLHRRFISDGYNFMCRKLFGIELRDTQCGLKLFRKRVLNEVIDCLKIKGFALDLELIVACKERMFRIADAPVNIYKQSGPGSVSVKTITQTFIDTLKVWYNKKRGVYGKEEI